MASESFSDAVENLRCTIQLSLYSIIIFAYCRRCFYIYAAKNLMKTTFNIRDKLKRKLGLIHRADEAHCVEYR
uniref:Transposase n=1 Tax=Syphacia muris TaxID=451379 RepID=A0A0N5ATK4_9BILA